MFSILYPFSKLTIFASHLRHILSELVSPTSRIFFQEAGFTALFFPCPGLQFKSHNHSVSISLRPPHSQPPSVLLLPFVFRVRMLCRSRPCRTPAYSQSFDHIRGGLEVGGCAIQQFHSSGCSKSWGKRRVLRGLWSLRGKEHRAGRDGLFLRAHLWTCWKA